jgi:hypothetical protein
MMNPVAIPRTLSSNLVEIAMGPAGKKTINKFDFVVVLNRSD